MPPAPMRPRTSKESRRVPEESAIRVRRFYGPRRRADRGSVKQDPPHEGDRQPALGDERVVELLEARALLLAVLVAEPLDLELAPGGGEVGRVVRARAGML